MRFKHLLMAALAVMLLVPHSAPQAQGEWDARASLHAAQERGSVATPTRLRPAAAARCERASAQLPMARRGVIETPQELARRMRASLAADPSGNRRIEGAYATPRDYLAAVLKAGGQVSGLSALPMYLETLVAGDMPSGIFRMSRITYVKRQDCRETYTLDIREGFRRAAMPGETGWFDPNTGRLILAGNCTNSPLEPVVPPAPLSPPTPAIPVTPTPRQPECVPVPPGVGNVYFPTIEDRGAWVDCNPHAECVTDCVDWLKGLNHSSNWQRRQLDEKYSNLVKQETGQGRRGGYMALKNITMMPVRREGITWVCEQGTHNYWRIDTFGVVTTVRD